jgi:FkbM family methyltransferase
MIKLVGSKFRAGFWRIGRSLYMRARGDIASEPEKNGEYFLIDCLLSVASKRTLTLIDVGANRGEWTLHANKVALEKKVKFTGYLFEPALDSYRFLKKTFLNDGHILVDHIALLDVTKDIDLKIVGPLAGTNSVFHQPELTPKSIEKIKAIRLSDHPEIKSIQSIDLLKVDTEGADFRVITGAYELFADEKIEMCQFEYNQRWIFAKNFLKDVFDLIPKESYFVGKLHATKIEIYDDWHPELERFFEGNYLIIRKNHPLISKIGVFTKFNKSNVPVARFKFGF